MAWHLAFTIIPNSAGSMAILIMKTIIMDLTHYDLEDFLITYYILYYIAWSSIKSTNLER